MNHRRTRTVPRTQHMTRPTSSPAPTNTARRMPTVPLHKKFTRLTTTAAAMKLRHRTRTMTKETATQTSSIWDAIQSNLFNCS